MVVTWAKPGDKNFKWCHVASKKEATIWRQQIAVKEGWDAGIGGGFYTEVEATNLRYPDGSRVVVSPAKLGGAAAIDEYVKRMQERRNLFGKK